MLKITLEPTSTCIQIGDMAFRLWQGRNHDGAQVVAYVLATGCNKATAPPGLKEEMDQVDAPQPPHLRAAIQHAAIQGIRAWQKTVSGAHGAVILGQSLPARDVI